MSTMNLVYIMDQIYTFFSSYISYRETV